jgi:hypothetical protein
MSTISTRRIVDELIANDGHYPDDPRVYLIVEYDTPEGQTVWGITYQFELDPFRYLQETPCVINPRVLWYVYGTIVMSPMQKEW